VLHVVTLIHAPLAAGDNGAKSVEWYAPQRLDGRLPDQPIDFLIVDGPPAYMLEASLRGTR